MKHAPNNSLQVTFDPPPIFATAKAGAVSNAPELRRYLTQMAYRSGKGDVFVRPRGHGNFRERTGAVNGRRSGYAEVKGFQSLCLPA